MVAVQGSVLDLAAEAANAPPPSLRPQWPRDYSLFLFGPDSALRQHCQGLVRQPLFESLIAVAIVIWCGCLLLDTPRRHVESPELAGLLRQADTFFTSLFVCEMLVKVIAFGFAFTEGAYLSSVWNRLDFATVMVSLIVLLAEHLTQLRPLRALRILRPLRTLRIVARSARMKLIITSFFKTLPALVNVVGFIIMLHAVFAILGMHIFSGKLSSCTDPAVTSRKDCVATGGGGGADLDLEWRSSELGSFDNFGEAMRLLFALSTADEWQTTMFEMMGATAVGVAPGRDDYSPLCLFPICWLLVSFIFASNLFVAVLVDNFNRIHKEQDGNSATMTLPQQQWQDTMQALLHAVPLKAPTPPECPLRKVLFGLATSATFDIFINGVIILNVLAMAYAPDPISTARAWWFRGEPAPAYGHDARDARHMTPAR